MPHISRWKIWWTCKCVELGACGEYYNKICSGYLVGWYEINWKYVGAAHMGQLLTSADSLMRRLVQKIIV